MNRFRTLPAAAWAVALLPCLALLAPATARAEAPPAPKKIVTIEGITEYRLDNGFASCFVPR